ncbi:Acidic endochitinase [Podochytrium sp. JEL0797]|nr:Acidic endochitinase [Podochytrium sp. JEL0797]
MQTFHDGFVVASDSKDGVAASTVAKKQRQRKIALIVGAVVLCAAIGGIAGYFGTRSSKSGSTTDSSISFVEGMSTGTSMLSPQATVAATASASVTVTTSIPSQTTPPALIGKQLIGYYGQNAIANGVGIVGGTNSRTTTWSDYQNTLGHYCNTTLYNTINLAFLNVFGGGSTFTITFAAFNDPQNYAGTYTYRGTGTETNSKDDVHGFLRLGDDIQLCQAMGVKIVLSLGGDKVSPYSFSVGDGAKYAQLFYDMFLQGNGQIRPFGPGVVLDGIELDVEKNDTPSIWTPEMISFLVKLRQLSPSTLLAVVPQCFLNEGLNKDVNTGDVITATASIINYIVVQFYNNPTCSYPFGFNFQAWKALYQGPIVIGLAGDWTSAISGGFLPPGQLQAVHDMVSKDSQFLGFSVYDVSSSNPPAFAWDATNFANPPRSAYSQTLRDVLDGKVVGTGFPPQGPAVSYLDLAKRCGGTWVHANATCSLLACTTNAQCGANQHCFSYLSKTC